MEGVGARFGRTSSRYGPATVFTGPVRKWKRKWVHVSPPSSGGGNQQNRQAATNAGANGSYLLLLKWTPITPSQNNNNAGNNGDADKIGDAKSSVKDHSVAAEAPPKRKFKYIPIALLEEQKSLEQLEGEAIPIESEANGGQPTSKTDSSLHEKPDINDLPMEDNQAPENDLPERQDLNESTLDLSLG